MSSPHISCDAKSSQLKIPQGLGRVPRVYPTKGHSLNSPGQSTPDWVSKRLWVGWQLVNGVGAWYPHHIFHIPHSSWEKWDLFSCLESSLLVSFVAYGGSRGACGAMVMWHKNISNVTLTDHMLCQGGKDFHKHKHIFTALSKAGPIGTDSNLKSGVWITAPSACPSQWRYQDLCIVWIAYLFWQASFPI